MSRVIDALLSFDAEPRVVVTCVDSGVGSHGGGPAARVKRAAHFCRLALRVARSDDSLVHCHSGSSSNLLGHWVVVLAAHLSGKRAILTLHGGDIAQRLRQSSPAGRAVRAVVRSADCVTAVSRDLASVAALVRGDQVLHVPNSLSRAARAGSAGGVIPADVEMFLDAHSPIVVAVGAMEPNYGIDLIVRAIAFARGAFPTIGLVVVAYKSSDVDYARHVRKEIDSLSMGGSVHIPSWLPSVDDVVSRSDLLVRACYEDGDPVSVRDALAVGVPVVASDVGFRPGSAVLFSPGDLRDLAAKVVGILEHPPPMVGMQDTERVDAASIYFGIYRQLARMA